MPEEEMKEPCAKDLQTKLSMQATAWVNLSRRRKMYTRWQKQTELLLITSGN